MRRTASRLSRLPVDRRRSALPRSSWTYTAPKHPAEEYDLRTFWDGNFTERHEIIFCKYLCAVPRHGPRPETGFDFKPLYKIFCKYKPVLEPYEENGDTVRVDSEYSGLTNCLYFLFCSSSSLQIFI